MANSDRMRVIFHGAMVLLVGLLCGWALLATGYGLMVGLIIQGITGTQAFSPTTNPVLMFAFIANLTGMLGSVLTASLTIMGAHAASREAVASIQSPS